MFSPCRILCGKNSQNYVVSGFFLSSQKWSIGTFCSLFLKGACQFCCPFKPTNAYGIYYAVFCIWIRFDYELSAGVYIYGSRQKEIKQINNKYLLLLFCFNCTENSRAVDPRSFLRIRIQLFYSIRIRIQLYKTEV